MKKLILMMAVSAASALQLNAQSSSSVQPSGNGMAARQSMKTPDDRANKDADWAEKKLGLTADQKEKWRAASLARIQANEPLRAQMRNATDKTEKQSLGTQMRSNGQKFDNTVNGFLTASQKATWEEVKQQRKEGHKGHRKGGMAPAGGSAPAVTPQD